jgi:hypothetical protein
MTHDLGEIWQLPLTTTGHSIFAKADNQRLGWVSFGIYLKRNKDQFIIDTRIRLPDITVTVIDNESTLENHVVVHTVRRRAVDNTVGVPKCFILAAALGSVRLSEKGNYLGSIRALVDVLYWLCGAAEQRNQDARNEKTPDHYFFSSGELPSTRWAGTALN